MLTVNAPGTYSLQVENDQSCKAIAIYTVLPQCNDITAATAFSPNGDGVNDIWNIYGLENDAKATISIFDRWGSRIYETLGSKPFWDGRAKNAAATVGVYYYVIVSKNSTTPIRGSITLIR